eukprot:scaffold1035_cov115-Cylindrotheca_fusiformis.AAC.4
MPEGVQKTADIVLIEHYIFMYCQIISTEILVVMPLQGLCRFVGCRPSHRHCSNNGNLRRKAESKRVP